MSICLLLFSGCSNKNNQKLYQKTAFDCGFDTFCSLNAYVSDETTFNEYYNQMVEEFLMYHKYFDIYHEYEGINNLKTINENAGIKPIEVDQIIIDLLKEAQAIGTLSLNRFDITSGQLLKVWHNYRDQGQIANQNGEDGEIPSEQELLDASIHHGYEHIIINEEKQTVYIDDPNIQIDVGGIGKGYATELVANKLQSEGLQNAAINAGGNQKIIGPKANGDGWNVGIQNPAIKLNQDESVIAVIDDVKENSVVTSGDYQNYYLGPNEETLGHIIDFKTLKPANHYHSVTIITKDSGLADCLSTTLFALNYEDGKLLIEKLSHEYQIEINYIYISDEPLDQTSIKSKTLHEYYLTYSPNLKENIRIN